MIYVPDAPWIGNDSYYDRDDDEGEKEEEEYDEWDDEPLSANE